MSNNPDEIRQDIERTRAELSDNVNALGDSAKPQNMVREKVDQVKEGANNLKERIFGSPYDPSDDGMVGEARDNVAGAVDDVRDRAADLAGDARDAVAQAPEQIKQRTRGNPLAVGLIALGVGALVGGLLPSTRFEQEQATRLKDAAEPVVEQAKQVASDVAGELKENLQPLAEQAAESVKQTAQAAGETVRDEAVAARDEVADQARWSAENVRGDAEVAVEETREEVQERREGF